jgi:hypothetical protein
MTNYVRQKEQSVGNCGPQNEEKNITEVSDIFRMFFTQELVQSCVKPFSMQNMKGLKLEQTLMTKVCDAY